LFFSQLVNIPLCQSPVDCVTPRGTTVSLNIFKEQVLGATSHVPQTNLRGRQPFCEISEKIDSLLSSIYCSITYYCCASRQKLEFGQLRDFRVGMYKHCTAASWQEKDTKAYKFFVTNIFFNSLEYASFWCISSLHFFFCCKHLVLAHYAKLMMTSDPNKYFSQIPRFI